MLNSITPTAGFAPAESSLGPVSVVTVNAKPRESTDSLFSQLATALKRRDATIVGLFIYGDVAARDHTTHVLRRYLGAIDWPVLWVEGRSCNGALVAGVQAFVVRGVEVERVLVNGRIVGTMFADSAARHCLIAGVGPTDPRASREDQTESTFENLSTALDRVGFGFADIARTWFYNERLLDWYDAFNRVRNRYYSAQPFRSGTVPASTGVEARNPAGAALAVAAWAVQPLNSSARVQEVLSPLQCPAPNYGSAFARAIEIESAGCRRLMVSGTASIAQDGKSLWLGDVAKQVATTMSVIDAILASRGMQFSDVTRATAYFKYPLDTAAFHHWLQIHAVAMPAVYVHCDICRDDLLFELELDACTASEPTGLG